LSTVNEVFHDVTTVVLFLTVSVNFHKRRVFCDVAVDVFMTAAYLVPVGNCMLQGSFLQSDAMGRFLG